MSTKRLTLMLTAAAGIVLSTSIGRTMDICDECPCPPETTCGAVTNLPIECASSYFCEFSCSQGFEVLNHQYFRWPSMPPTEWIDCMVVGCAGLAYTYGNTFCGNLYSCELLPSGKCVRSEIGLATFYWGWYASTSETCCQCTY